MSYNSERIGYAPTQLPSNPDELSVVLQEEFWRIQNVLDYIQKGYRDTLHVEPDKRREFMVVAADGTNWNPGHGAGLYVYKGGEWHWLFDFGAVFNSLPIPGTQLTHSAANTPQFQQFRDDGAGSTGVYAWHFDDSQLEQSFFSVILPHDYKEGTDLLVHFHWAPATANTGNVYFGMEYTIQNFDAVFPTTTVVAGTVAADGTALKHQTAVGATITGTGLKVGAILLFRIWRDGGHASDTLTGDAAFLAAHIHYQMNGLTEEVT